ncbi:unnamed protein product [Fusarium fujikuroi]|uniref:DUF6594 domain-containing protein n=1 Tax=Fusarium fujikuroi TaxID=5127 RepID=A0A9Q9RMT7_FUSFU|nr:unnamed protein product [Fusarium fujikuroi]VTT68370.1 unnamed protein product [Fusarium fujikuroi]
MYDPENDRRRTNPDYDSSSDEEPQNYRSRVEEYANKPDWPRQPLYEINEVVYVAVPGQAQPTGPYIIISTNFENRTYGLKRQDTGQMHLTAVAEVDLRVTRAQGSAVRKEARQHSSGDTERRALLSEIEGKLNDFKRPEPEESQIKSVRNWVDGKRPVVYSETTFLNDWSDLKRARHTVEKGGLENLLASYSSWPSLRGIYEFFSLLDTSARSDDPKVKLIKASRLVAVSRALTTVLAVTTLVVPIGVLYSVHPVPMRLCIIAAFTCIFSSALCWLTSSRNYEIFSATAAYCAVMVVFVGSLP